MKIGRLIERNVFTFLWLFFFISRLFVYFIGRKYQYEYEKYFYGSYAGKYICWPYIFLFPRNDHSVGDAIIACAMGLVSFIAVDFLLRKIFWDKKKNIEPVLPENLKKTPKILILQTVTGLVKWTGRLCAAVMIPFLMFFIDGYRYSMYDKETLQRLNEHVLTYQLNFAGASIAIFGCIIGWRFPLIGAVMLLTWIVPFQISEGKIFLDGIFILFDIAAIAFFTTWALRRFSERTLKKNIV